MVQNRAEKSFEKEKEKTKIRFHGKSVNIFPIFFSFNHFRNGKSRCVQKIELKNFHFPSNNGTFRKSRHVDFNPFRIEFRNENWHVYVKLNFKTIEINRFEIGGTKRAPESKIHTG